MCSCAGLAGPFDLPLQENISGGKQEATRFLSQNHLHSAFLLLGFMNAGRPTHRE